MQKSSVTARFFVSKSRAHRGRARTRAAFAGMRICKSDWTAFAPPFPLWRQALPGSHGVRAGAPEKVDAAWMALG